MTAIAAHRDFLSDVLARQKARRSTIDPAFAFPLQPTLGQGGRTSQSSHPSQPSGPASKANVVGYVPAEETVRNDYTAWYGVSGHSVAEHVQGARDHELCEEYPALKKLMALKKQVASQYACPPLYAPLTSTTPSSILSALAPSRFDVILITSTGTWDETAQLPIRELSADPSFVFLWVGRGDQDGLERGRECLAKWGFRRAEDIVWVRRRALGAQPTDTRGVGRGGLLGSLKEHCLMGIRGTVRRSTDTRFVHCNVDTDIIIWDDDASEDGARYPPYLYNLIENFCLGTRRLQLFSPPSQVRRGWVTANALPFPSDKQEEGVLRFDSASYPSLLPGDERGVLPYIPEIDNLRPKSPVKGHKGKKPSNAMSNPGLPPLSVWPPRPPAGHGTRGEYRPHQGSMGSMSGSAYGRAGFGSRDYQPAYAPPPTLGHYNPHFQPFHPESMADFHPAAYGGTYGDQPSFDPRLLQMMNAMQIQQQRQQQQYTFQQPSYGATGYDPMAQQTDYYAYHQGDVAHAGETYGSQRGRGGYLSHQSQGHGHVQGEYPSAYGDRWQ